MGCLLEAGWVDLTGVVLSVGAVFAVGAWRPAGKLNDYLMAGRNLSLPAFVMSLVSSWYGGILGVSEYSYLYGLSNWFVFGIPYYLYALIFALVLAKRARAAQLMSLPDRFQQAYGTGAARACGAIIFLTAMPAAYLLMLGKLIEWMFGWPYHASLIVGAAVSTLFLFPTGLRGVVQGHLLQFALMYAGFALMVSMLYREFGGLEFIRAHVEPQLLSPTGGQAIGAVLVWYVIASTTLVEPLFYERSYAARSEKLVLPGILIALGFWAIFDFMTTATGLYARAILGEIQSPVFAFPELARQVLPAGAFGLFLAAMVATVASTIDSYVFIAGAALGRDVVMRGRATGETEELRWVKLGAAIGLVCALSLAWFSESVVSLWHAIGSITAPALLFPALWAWFGRRQLRERPVVFSMIASGLAALIWRVSNLFTGNGDYWLGVEPIFIGLAISVLTLLPIMVRRP